MANAKSAIDVVNRLTDLLDNGVVQQGGSGHAFHELLYSSGFIIVDAQSAYVLETANNEWAWKAIAVPNDGDCFALSNAPTIGTDYDQASAGIRGKDFAATVTDRLTTWAAEGCRRRERVLQMLADVHSISDCFRYFV